jgi:hypothetical protein
MDLHVYRNSEDRWQHLRSAAQQHGAVLALNALTLGELAARLTPEINIATPGQRLAIVAKARPLAGPFSNLLRYACDAVSELKAARVRSDELQEAGAGLLSQVLGCYEQALAHAALHDPQDRFEMAAARVIAGDVPWLDRFERVVLHALYDLTEAEFLLVRSLIDKLPGGGAVVLFNSTANVKPTQFAEWTWQRFVQDESLAEKTFPEFCRAAHPTRAVLERLFDFEPHEPLPPDGWLRVIEAPSRFKEIEAIGGAILDLVGSGENPSGIAVVVRQVETYGELLEDVFTRYRIPYRFDTGVPLLRVPLVKYWLAMLDLAGSERARQAMARVMSSAYFAPRLSPAVDVERVLSSFGYIDRHHQRASALGARQNSPLVPEIERFERLLDALEHARDTLSGFMARLPVPRPMTERDRQAWSVLTEEITAVDAVYQRLGRPAVLDFGDFRRIVSEVAGLRTVDRFDASAAPPGLPRVRIMHPQSLGAVEYKWIFAPGFAEGEFPARMSANPLLTDEMIDAIHARIRPRRLMRARDRSRREPLYLFMILDSAACRATLTYPSSTLEGEPIHPSSYIAEIARHYAESPVVRAGRGQPRTDGEWRTSVARQWREGTISEEQARTLLGHSIVDRALLESKGAARSRLGRGVLPLDGVWHPSELNSLASCPFVFFVRHRLDLRATEMPDFEVPAMEIGILAHTILRDFYALPRPASLEEARARMNEIIARRLSGADVNSQGRYSVFDPSLWKIRRRQLVSVLNRYVDFAVRDALDGFQTRPEYLDTPLPAASLGRILVSGRPDHVAVHQSNGNVDAIRIDDFKYSAASSGTGRQLKQSFQIPVYAYLAARALGAAAGARIEGRYLLLRSPGTPVVSQTIDDTLFGELRERVDALVHKVFEGRLEPDPADPQICADCDYRRLCRLYGQ